MTTETQSEEEQTRTSRPKAYPHPGYHRLLEYVKEAYLDFASQADIPQTEQNLNSAAESTKIVILETGEDPIDATRLISIYGRNRFFSDMADVGDVQRATNNTLEAKAQTGRDIADVRKLISLYGSRDYIGMIGIQDVSYAVCDTLKAMKETCADLHEVVSLIKAYNNLEFMNCEGLSNLVCGSLRQSQKSFS